MNCFSEPHVIGEKGSLEAGEALDEPAGAEQLVRAEFGVDGRRFSECREFI